ncbi:MAG: response regulator [Nitrospinota bacterium]|nr:response regulator [Nitrospinota bacterium]
MDNTSGETQGQASPPKVMAVDDSPIALKKYASTLGNAGYEYRPVQDPKTALDAIAEFRPDIILMDQIMPGVDGFELTKMIVATQGMEKIKIIMVSSDNKKDTVVKAIQGGAVDFLMKPFDDDTLLAKIKLHLSRK